MLLAVIGCIPLLHLRLAKKHSSLPTEKRIYTHSHAMLGSRQLQLWHGYCIDSKTDVQLHLIIPAPARQTLLVCCTDFCLFIDTPPMHEHIITFVLQWSIN